jgi:hypothetical protein
MLLLRLSLRILLCEKNIKYQKKDHNWALRK